MKRKYEYKGNAFEISVRLGFATTSEKRKKLHSVTITNAEGHKRILVATTEDLEDTIKQLKNDYERTIDGEKVFGSEAEKILNKLGFE